MRRVAAVVVWSVALVVAAVSSIAAAPEESGRAAFANLEWRNVGPVNMSGRVADVEGVAGNPRVVWVGSASGGVWKTTNGGLTFEPVFDEQPIASIGDIGVAPSNSDVVYVGTGESALRNSVSFGNGVYKTTDGGQSWTHVGLEDTRHISKVLVHPTDPEKVYVGAFGHMSGPNEERGVFRTTDGGASWEKVLYLDDRHGVSDMAMDPTNPNILFACLWRFDRKPWTHTSGSEEGGVWHSVDGGDNWTKIDKGLPKLMGRIGVAVSRSNPEVVYVIAESNEGTLFRSDDRGLSFHNVSEKREIVSRGFYYTHVRIDPSDSNRIYAVASSLYRSIDGGRSFERISKTTHGDYHALWIDPEDPHRLWQGQDGGVAVSYDQGDTWEPLRNLPIGQFYQVYADNRQPFYYVGGGLQDNGAWYGPSRTREPFGILEDDWRMMSFGDAYWVVADVDDPDRVISEWQAGGIVRTDLRTRQQTDISPQPRRNDGGPVGELEYRFNWNAPIIRSPHDADTIYFGANVVFKSPDFGTSWEIISPDLTTDDPAKQGEAGGPAWKENTTAEYHCTIISLAESEVEAGVLWAGTDDGNLQLSRDGGASWTNVAGNVRGLPEYSPVSHIEPSQLSAGRAWAAFDRHLFDDFRPLIYRTDDFGATWTPVAGDLPEGAWVWVVRQDPRNHDVLYAGTELGLYASRDGGRHWQRLHLANLPTVAVHDILIHPRDNDLILGTHGRAIWIFDDATPLQEYDDEVAAEAAHLFPVRNAVRYSARPTRYGLGDKTLKAPNPPDGGLITYSLGEDVGGGDEGEGEESEREGRLKIEILDADGAVIRTLKDLPTEAGVNRAAWDLAMDPPTVFRRDEEMEEWFGKAKGPMVLPGTYTVRLTLDGANTEQQLAVTVDPTVEVGEVALEKQFASATALCHAYSALNRAARGLDAVAKQLAAREATTKQLSDDDLPESLNKLFKESGDHLETLIESIAGDEELGGWSEGPQLADQVFFLLMNVDSAFAAPTAAQNELQAELMAAVEAKLGEMNAFFAGGIDELNTKLGEQGVAPLTAPRAVVLGSDEG